MILRNPLSGHSPSANRWSVRILAVLAALCLVCAFGLAVLLPPAMSLAELIARIDHSVLLGLQDWTVRNLSEATWRNLALPLLVRPDWLSPFMLGMVFAGIALTLASRAVGQSRRRRS